MQREQGATHEGGDNDTKASTASRANKQVGQQTGARRRTAAEEEQDERIRREDPAAEGGPA